MDAIASHALPALVAGMHAFATVRPCSEKPGHQGRVIGSP
jgi:hypothetical protein